MACINNPLTRPKNAAPHPSPPSSLTQASRPAARSPAPRRTAPPTPAALPPQLITTLAEAASKPGSVDAPVWAIAVGAVVVTAGALLLASGLKPGEK